VLVADEARSIDSEDLVAFAQLLIEGQMQRVDLGDATGQMIELQDGGIVEWTVESNLKTSLDVRTSRTEEGRERDVVRLETRDETPIERRRGETQRQTIDTTVELEQRDEIGHGIAPLVSTAMRRAVRRMRTKRTAESIAERTTRSRTKSEEHGDEHASLHRSLDCSAHRRRSTFAFVLSFALNNNEVQSTNENKHSSANRQRERESETRDQSRRYSIVHRLRGIVCRERRVTDLDSCDGFIKRKKRERETKSNGRGTEQQIDV
jgi:hypothetical protein